MEELKFHISAISIALMIICTILLLETIYFWDVLLTTPENTVHIAREEYDYQACDSNKDIPLECRIGYVYGISYTMCGY